MCQKEGNAAGPIKVICCFHSSLTTQLLVYLHMALSAVSASLLLVPQFLCMRNSSWQYKILVTLYTYCYMHNNPVTLEL